MPAVVVEPPNASIIVGAFFKHSPKVLLRRGDPISPRVQGRRGGKSLPPSAVNPGGGREGLTSKGASCKSEEPAGQRSDLYPLLSPFLSPPPPLPSQDQNKRKCRRRPWNTKERLSLALSLARSPSPPLSLGFPQKRGPLVSGQCRQHFLMVLSPHPALSSLTSRGKQAALGQNEI